MVRNLHDRLACIFAVAWTTGRQRNADRDRIEDGIRCRTENPTKR